MEYHAASHSKHRRREPRQGAIPIQFIIAFILLLVLGQAGCSLFKPEPENTDTTVETGKDGASLDSVPEPPGRDASVFERPLQRLVVEFKVHRFTAPHGTFSEESRLWKLVTGKLPDASQRLRLADNGFRAAIGRESDRFPLRKWLDSLSEVAGASDTTVPDASKLVDVDIGACEPRIVVFYYDAAGGLSGHEFVQARARFRIAFELRPPDLQTSVLTVVPEIEEPPGPPKWIITEAGAQQIPQERRYPFDDLEFRSEIPAGGFLLLGPAKSVYDQPLLGRAFFGSAALSHAAGDGEGERENIFIISPIIRAYTGAERSARQGAADAPM